MPIIIRPKHKILNTLSDFGIVGIGSSAGGLEALEEFFKHAAVNSGLAYVVIQHLDPTREGILPELLQRMTLMKVVEAKDDMLVKQNCIYVIPHNKTMSIYRGRLKLFEPVIKDGLRLPIDYFFRSLAEDVHERSIGIILSGMGSDGTLGLKAIKERFGIVLVQNPASAKFDSMPRSAMESVVVDIVAEAKDLPKKLNDFLNNIIEIEDKPKAFSDNMKAINQIFTMLKHSKGNDFNQYKSNMVYRRIERRMSIHHISNIVSYADFLRDNPTEIKLLFKELLIGVTNFFRDAKLWEALSSKYLTELIKRHSDKDVLRAWIPACSSGEEAYSLAIIFKEMQETIPPAKRISLQIFATDLDDVAIDKARKGVFDENISVDVSPKRLKRFFRSEKNLYHVSNDIREMIIFAPQNLIKDPPFTNIDFVSCRNLLIYLNADMQKKVLDIFRYSINEGGLLVLGSAETIVDDDKTFSQLDGVQKIYMSKIQDKKTFVFHANKDSDEIVKKDFIKKNNIKTLTKIENLAERVIVQQFAPPGLLVNKAGNIINISGHTGKFLELPIGKTNPSIFAMIKEGIRGEFGRAFNKAIKQKKSVTISEIQTDAKQSVNRLDITIQLLSSPSVLKDLVIIVFSEVLLERKNAKGSKHTPEKRNINERTLYRELQKTKENLQANEEEMQTSQEELKSVNEELQSNIEELQSSNEELTTSKEEMQSLNEELHTVNAEMQSKLNNFERVNSDLKNLLNSTEIAVIFLDTKSRITQFTHSATTIFNLRYGDIGRPYTDLTSSIIYPEMKNDITEVLRSLVSVEKEIRSKSGIWYKVRVMPYRSLDDRIDGLVITFLDITVSKVLEYKMRKNEVKSQTLMNSVSYIIISISSDERILSINKSAELFYRVSEALVLEKNYYSVFVPDVLCEKVRTVIASLSKSKASIDFKTTEKDNSGNIKTIDWQANKMIVDEESVSDIIIVGKVCL